MSTNPNTRNFFNSIGDPDEIGSRGTEVLKLAICRHFVRYFIESPVGMIVFYGDYALHGVSTMDDLAGQLSAIFAKDSFLHKSFNEVKVCWFTDFEIIPAAFFSVSELTADVSYSIIMDGEAHFIFEVPSVVYQVIHQQYSMAENYHSGAVLIQRLIKEELAGPDKFFINVQADTVEIVYFDSMSRLRIYNRYEYKAYQDYIYYVLLVADEMQIDRQNVKAVLMGEVSEDSQLYEVTRRYFMNIAFIGQPEDKHFARAFDEYPKHLNYTLYNL